MNALKYTVVIAIFSFSSMVFSYTINDLKKGIDEIEKLDFKNLFGLVAKTNRIYAIVKSINHEAFGATDKLLNRAMHNLVVTHAASLQKASSELYYGATDVEDILKPLSSIDEEVDELQEEDYYISERKAIKEQLLRLYTIFSKFKEELLLGKKD